LIRQSKNTGYVFGCRYGAAMNIAQAKQIPLEDVLEKLGHVPDRQQGDDIWYQSPFREEQDASFKINRRLNVWYDHGEGKGGTVIELIQQLYRVPDVSQTLSTLRELFGETPPTRLVHRQQRELIETTPSIEINSVTPIRAKSLLSYLAKRGINPEHAKPYIHEVHYRAKDKNYFAIGFANDDGGYELRNPYFKGSTSKNITTIKGNPTRVICFEGFFDYLTALTMNAGLLDATVIVLNSVSKKEQAISTIRTLCPNAVELYRDNDAAGQNLLSFFKGELPDIEVIDKAADYASHADLNDWHCANLNRVESASRHPHA